MRVTLNFPDRQYTTRAGASNFSLSLAEYLQSISSPVILLSAQSSRVKGQRVTFPFLDPLFRQSQGRGNDMAHSDPHQLGALWEQSRSGSVQARDALMGKLRAYVKALIRSWLGPDLARQLGDSDIAQEALLKITQNYASFRGQSLPELLGWAKRIAYHATLDRKSRPAGPAGAGQASADVLQALPADEPPPLQVLADEEDAVRLAEALERLSPARRDVIHARLFDRWSFAEISRRTGRREGALRVLFVRAVRQLRTFLDLETPT
jgi:RNA polymerase sigma-70 factor (ECF subfamily)